MVQGLYDLCKSLPAKVKSPLDPYNESPVKSPVLVG